MPAATVTNNATGVLASNLASGATSLTLQTGQGARFPTITGTNYFWGTLIDASNNIEIVRCTAHTAASDTFTITRAQQSTTAKAYVAGDRFEMRVTREHFNEKVSKSGDTMTGFLTNNIGIYSAAPYGAPMSGDTLLVNSDFIYRNTRLRVDTAFPVEVSPYALAFKATNGKWYILYASARSNLIDAPYFGTGGFPTDQRIQTSLVEIPTYVEGVGPLDYNEVILATDPAEVTVIAWDDAGYIVATGLAGAGSFGIGNATDQVQWRLIWNFLDSSKAWWGEQPRKVLTNNRGLAVSDVNQTVWVLTNYNKIWATGEGATGALGQNSTVDSTIWVATQDTTGSVLNFISDAWCPVQTVSPSIMCQDFFGAWYGLGYGAAGILGAGSVANRLRWTAIPELPTSTPTKVMFAGQNAVMDCMILFPDGQLWGAGDNNNGSLGDGTTVLKSTFAVRATDVADFWMAGNKYSTGANTTWIKKTDGTLHTTGVSSYYQCLMGNTTQKTTFSAATDIPAGYFVNAVWPGCAEAQGFFYSRWVDGSGNYKIMSVGYAVDGTRGNNAVSGTVHSDITNLLPVPANEIVWMEAMHSVNANRKGYGLLLTTKGELYATGRVLPSSDGGTTYVSSPFPWKDSPMMATVFTKVPIEDLAA
jgi:hypothetical protein